MSPVTRRRAMLFDNYMFFLPSLMRRDSFYRASGTEYNEVPECIFFLSRSITGISGW